MKRQKKVPFQMTLLAALAIILALGLAGVRPTSADGLAPRVVGFSPTANASQVSVDAVVTVTWDRPMAPESDFVVTSSAGFVDGTFAYNPQTFTITFSPREYLRPETRYDALVTGQIDAQGQWQQELVQWSFTTVVPTSVSLTDFSPADTGSNWWWTAWPWLMLFVSAGSLVGLFRLVNRRPAVDAEAID
jgi:hypothetical protein